MAWSKIYKQPRDCSDAWEGTCTFQKSLWNGTSVSNETEKD